MPCHGMPPARYAGPGHWYQTVAQDPGYAAAFDASAIRALGGYVLTRQATNVAARASGIDRTSEERDHTNASFVR